jgi:hypothetical protein
MADDRDAPERGTAKLGYEPFRIHTVHAERNVCRAKCLFPVINAIGRPIPAARVQYQPQLGGGVVWGYLDESSSRNT